MRIWADLFEEVVVCSAAATGPMRGNLAPYNRSNIGWIPVSYDMDVSVRSQFRRATQFPGLIWNILKVVRTTDFVHLRSPSHFGLVGAAIVRVLGRTSLTKWAGENAPYQGERSHEAKQMDRDDLPGKAPGPRVWAPEGSSTRFRLSLQS